MNLKLSGKNLVLQYEVDEQLLEKESLKLYNCPKRIKYILVNLISNAIKFTVQGTITVIISGFNNNPNFLQVKVKDTGCGIPSDIIQKLGQPFTTFDNDKQQMNQDGIGLGLFICKKIIRQLGPSQVIDIQSVLNKGSVFSFIIFRKNPNVVEKISTSIDDQINKIEPVLVNKSNE